MTSIETKQLLIETGARLFHQNGYNNTGIAEILSASGIPKGSFYFHFKSKEDFALTVIDHYSQFLKGWFDQYAEDTNKSPLTRLRNFLESFIVFYEGSGCRLGCPIGNFALEMSDLSEPIRKKINSVLLLIRDSIETIIKDAKSMGEIPMEINTLDIADFIMSSWEGALLVMKSGKSTEPLKRFINILFTYILTTNNRA
ncbi:MAG: TetR family transcriptional regulator C-terminal domain-containing protein [Nitrospirae bacterium]|nr:TetR family transcriptional regulator C-terminal domain-containing protein [Nitrospirota bacterium]